MGNLIKSIMIKGTIAALVFSGGAASIASAEVTRLSGSDRYSTADAIVKTGWPKEAKTVILASGLDANKVDALTVAPLSKAKNAPLVLVNPQDSTDNIVAKFKTLNTTTIYIANGEGVISLKIEEDLKKAGIRVIRLGGASRYETALNIAKELEPSTNIVIASGHDDNLVDSLSIAPIAAAKGMPIFLSDNRLDSATTDYINGLNVKTTYVVSGPNAIPYGSTISLKGVVRLFGSGRYETNARIIDHFKNDTTLNFNNIFIASGENANLIDALAGAPLAASKGSPIIFVHDTINPTVDTLLKSIVNENTKIIELGSTNAVSDKAENTINEIQANALKLTPENKVTSVSVINNKLTVTLKDIPELAPKINDFVISRIINDTTKSYIIPSELEYDSKTKVSFRLSQIKSTSETQNVVYSVSYKKTTPITSGVINVPPVSNLEVNSGKPINITKNESETYVLPTTVTNNDSKTNTETDKSGGNLPSSNNTRVIQPMLLNLNKTTSSLYVGETDQLTTTILPSDATNKSVIWTSSNPAIATVDNTGKLTALNEGTASITATTCDGNIKATCTVVNSTKYFQSLLGGVPEPVPVIFQPSFNSDFSVVTYRCSSTNFNFDDYIKLLTKHGWKYTHTNHTGASSDFYFAKDKYVITVKTYTNGIINTEIVGNAR